MMFPPGYRDLKSYRVFKQLSGLEYPIEAIFTLHNEIQVSGVYTIRVMDDEDFLYLLGITQEGITGERIRNALLRSEMFEATEDPHVFYAKEFVELNKGLKASRENGGNNKSRSNKTDRRSSESNESINRPTEEPINRLTDEPINRPIDEGMNGTVPNRLPTDNPQVTHGYPNHQDESDDYDDEPLF